MKILYVTTIGLTMTFFKNLVRSLLDDGHTVDIVTNEAEEPVPPCYHQWNCKVFHHTCSRFPLSIQNLKSIGTIKKVVEENQYEIVHCHTPVAAMCTRLACRKLRKKGIKVFYTAHGFHFYKGAPMQNWILYFPVEWLCSFFTDVLITINQEDYIFAKKHLHAKSVEYVPGVGIDVEKFKNTVVDRTEKRQELGIPEDAFLMVSVGELNKNKNHEVVLRAMAELNDKRIHYAIAGVGLLKEYLLHLAKELQISDRFHLLGYRNDVAEIYKAADVCCFPSIREGLGLAAIEGMAAGLPIITSIGRGMDEYSIDGVTGYKCNALDVNGFATAICELQKNSDKRCQIGRENILRARQFDVQHSVDAMRRIYERIWL